MAYLRPHAALALLLALPACAGDDPPSPPVQRDLNPFASCDDLLAYAKDHAHQAIDEGGWLYSELGWQGGWGGLTSTSDGVTSFDFTGTDGGSGPITGDTNSASDTITSSGSSGTSGGTTGGATGGDSGGDSGGDPDYSGTNVQEAGVDEPDLIKTDGTRIFALAQGSLHYVDTTGPAPVRLGSIPLGASYEAGEIFLHGDRVLHLQRFSDYDGVLPAEVLAWLGQSGYTVTRITEIDVHDPMAMKVLGNLYITGDYLSARRIDGDARVIIRSYPAGLALTDPWGEIYEILSADPNKEPQTEAEWQALWDQAVSQAKDKNHAAVDASTLDNWVPHYLFEDMSQGSPVYSDGRLLDCLDAMYPSVYAGLAMTTVLTVDLEAGLSPFGGVGLFAEGATVYASPENLYVATKRWEGAGWGDPGFWPDGGSGGGSGGDPTLTGSTSATSGSSSGSSATVTAGLDPVLPAGRLGPGEDRRALYWREGDAGQTTFIHKFAIPAGERAEYLASGTVVGTLLSQWSMSEHRGDLRVASTNKPSADINTWQSFVTVLREDPGAGLLGEIGKVGGLGPTEEIKGVRFIGDIGYVVTFRQTDPLYTVDASDPTAPQVAGELKITGYSAYLHPIADGYLIGVGYDATDQGMLLGVQLSLFDVRNIYDPIRTDQVAFGDFGFTEVAFDHRAFLYWDPTKLALFPVESYGSYDEPPFVGAAGYTVDPEAGIDPVGLITHVSADDPWNYWAATLRRSLVIGGLAYTLSEAGLKASNLADLSDHAFVAW